MLKHIAFIVGLACMGASCTTSQVKEDYTNALLPTPVEMKTQSGSYTLKKDVKVQVIDPSLIPAAQYLQEILKNVAPESSIESEGDIVLTLHNDTVSGAYQLEILSDKVIISGSDYEGVVNGISTLRQLLPPAAEMIQEDDYNKVAGTLPVCTLPLVKISDSPKFQWRGMMLDASRHFWNKEEVKRMLDLMASYKLNKFHWHLTDDQGWRVEIKQYPLLTEKGAWRPLDTTHDKICKERAVKEDNKEFLLPEDKLKVTAEGDTLYGGFYTQEDIREIVAYATQRGIEVIPEVDMPGHFLAAISQYPDLACKGMIGWGKTFSSPVCPGKDATLEFCKNVYKEIFQLFPSQYVHLGGDEVEKINWSKCADCRRRMQTEHLKSVEQLQAWFVRQMEQFFLANGKRMIGWDEVVGDGLSDQTTIMWWRGWEADAPLQAANQGKDIIHTPNTCFYFDYKQDKNTFRQILTFNPYDGLEKSQYKYVKGMQANVWTEWIPTVQRLDYMIAPRMIALAEVAWGQASYTDDAPFYEKLASHFERLANRKINYRIPDIEGFYSRNAFIGQDTLNIVSRIPNVEIRYTTDGSIPNKQSELYTGALPVNTSTDFCLRTYRPDGTPGDIVKTIFSKEEYVEVSQDAGALKNGLQATWYDYAGDSCSQITSAPLKGKYVIDEVKIPEGVKGNIGLVITGYINVPEDGVYTFSLTSDDGSLMSIDGTPVLLNDGPHAAEEYIGQKALSKGLHSIELRYFDHNGGMLELKMIEEDGKKVAVPQEWFKY